MQRTYAAIVLKSFYSSVKCADRNLNPLSTNLVVADTSRTEKTICLAVSPSLKAGGIPERPRLFEVVQKMKEVNAQRKAKAPNHAFTSTFLMHPPLPQTRPVSCPISPHLPECPDIWRFVPLFTGFT